LSRQRDTFDAQLQYLSDLSKRYNVILVDDASTDGSWERIQAVAPGSDPRLRLIRMEKNGQKVLAVKRALETSDADYIVLLDFDSRFVNPEALPLVVQRFEADPLVAGISLKVVPEGTSLFSRLQDVEYAVFRKIFCGYLGAQGKIRCVPGAAGVWKRRVLLEVLGEHSGRHNGDDFESTVIALRSGYATEHSDEVTVTTAVPQTPRALFTQRRRWELGSLETYGKEHRFLFGQVKNPRSRLGHVVLLDMYTWASAILFPLFLVYSVLDLRVASIYACFELALVSLMCYLARKEMKTKRELVFAPFFPVYWLMILIPRTAAVIKFATGGLRSRGSAGPIVSLAVRGRATSSPLPVPESVVKAILVSE
jgi:cellulose synthase/poly-beta-1,6-N-acetylglucosamine synthase-like glycosyltransferase